MLNKYWYWYWFANNKGVDKPAHTRSLISDFVIRLMESVISRLAIREILIFELVSNLIGLSNKL